MAQKFLRFWSNLLEVASPPPRRKARSPRCRSQVISNPRGSSACPTGSQRPPTRPAQWRCKKKRPPSGLIGPKGGPTSSTIRSPVGEHAGAVVQRRKDFFLESARSDWRRWMERTSWRAKRGVLKDPSDEGDSTQAAGLDVGPWLGELSKSRFLGVRFIVSGRRQGKCECCASEERPWERTRMPWDK